MPTMIRYRLLAIGLFLGMLAFKGLLLVVGCLLMAAAGLLIVQEYWLCMLVLVVAVLVYEAGYWLLVGRWVRGAA